MISWRFIGRGFVYAWDVGTGVKWAMVCPLVLTSFIWLIVYTYLGISVVPPPPLDLPRKQQGELSQRSRPDHRRFYQHHISLLPRHRPRLCMIQRKSDSAIISGASILVDKIIHSHNALNISECCPSDQIRAQLPPYTPHFGLASITNTNGRPRITYTTKHFHHFVHHHLLTSNNKAHAFLGVFLMYKESSSSSEMIPRELSYRTEWRRCFGLSLYLKITALVIS